MSLLAYALPGWGHVVMCWGRQVRLHVRQLTHPAPLQAKPTAAADDDDDDGGGGDDGDLQSADDESAAAGAY
jgi:hypothetical protein